jgi:hypothetical protein
MKNNLLLSFILLAISGIAFAQATAPYSCSNLTVDSIQSSKLNPAQIQLTITNHDSTQTWGPTYFCITNLAGDTISTDVTCGCVVLLRNKTGIFYVDPKDPSFRVPPNFSCHLSLTGSGVVCSKEYNPIILTGFVTQASQGTSLNLFPNPSTGTFTVDLGDLPGPDTHLCLVNIQGQHVYEEPLYSRETNVNLHALSRGIYFVQISGQGRLLETKKIVLR